MLHYPKIPGSGAAPLARCVAFEKYDGTNLHFDWDRDFGWHAYGTRRDVFNLHAEGIASFNLAHPGLEEVAPLFLATLAEGLDLVLRTHEPYTGYQSVRAFAEFLGTGSFAGMHRADDPKELRLFDVELEGYGFVNPWQFVEDFGHLSSARVVYQGKLTGKFIEDVRTGRYNVAEGVIAKGGTGGLDVWMCKIKTLAYLARLQQSFAERWQDYWE
jgi:hypothetical protein